MDGFDTYNPFDKSLSEINTEDLLKLRQVHEGWYVDYKAEPINTKQYAKAVSAMANTYGGWIFIGIQEESRDNNIAGSFNGVPFLETDLNCQKIRQAVAQNLNPQPFFEIRTLTSPEAINESKIICIYVPASPKAPIIHSDGRIYRRVNDASEPVPENNRDAVDHLLQRNQKIINQYRDWFDKDPELSKGEENVSYLRLMATPDYWREKKLWFSENTEDFKKLVLEKPDGVSYSVNYNNIYTNRGGFVCRSTINNNPRQINNTLIMRRDLRCEIWIPIPSFDVANYLNYNNRSVALDQLVQYISDEGYDDCSCLDFTQLFGAIDGFFALHKKFQNSLGYNGKTYVKFKLMNVWRKIPIIEASPNELCWDDYGVPMILNEEMSSPRDGNVRTFFPLNLHKEKETSFLLSMPIFIELLSAVGLGAGSNKNFSDIAHKAITQSYEKAVKS